MGSGMSKKAKRNTWVIVLLVLAVLVVLGFVFKEQLFGVVGEGAKDDIVEDVKKDIILADLTCPDDGITTLNIYLEDDYASTTTYLTGTNNLKVKDFSAGKIISTTSSSSSAYATANVDCGNEIVVYAISDSAVAGSGESEKFVASGNNMYLTLHTGQLSNFTVKAKDIDNDDWENLHADNGAISGAGSTNSTTGVVMNATRVVDDAIGTELAVSTDGYIDFEIYLKTTANREKANDFGKLGNGDSPARLDLAQYVCVDLGGATNGQEWDSNSVKVTWEGGDSLANVKDEIDADSKEYLWLQNSEACYKIGDVSDTYKVLGFYAKAKSGQDPDNTDDDIILYFLGEGTYESSDVSNTIKTGIFTDASTQTAVLFDLGVADPHITLEIS